MPRTGLWTYFKRGLAYYLLSLVVGFLGGLAIVGLMTQPPAVIVLGFVIAVPIALVLIGWMVSVVVQKVN